MSSDVTQNELWQAFFTEVTEQLDTLELILSAPDAAEQADIHQLFREFHTIKSSCAMMDFHSMERIAHASEDYLDIVRKGRAQLQADTINTLLSAIDWLKSQLQHTRSTGEVPTDNTALYHTLQALSASHAAAAPVETPHTTTATATPTATPAPAEHRLSEEEVEEFSSACKEQLLIGLFPNAEPAITKRALSKLATICNLVNFTALSNLLRQYIRQNTEQDIQRLRATAANILDRLRPIEKQYATDCGLQALHAQFLDTLFPDFAQFSGRMAFLLDTLEQHTDDAQAYTDCEQLLQTLIVYASLFGLQPLQQFYRYALQVLRSIRRSDFSDSQAAFDALRQAFDFPVNEQANVDSTDTLSYNAQLKQTELQAAITQALLGARYEKARDVVMATLDIDAVSISQLMPLSLSQLHDAVCEHQAIATVMLDASGEPSRLDALVTALTQHCNVIHTTTGLAGQTDAPFSESLHALVTSTQPLDVLAQALQRASGTTQYFRITPLSYRDASATPTSTDTKPAHSTPARASVTLRVDSGALDRLVTQVGEIIMLRNRLQHLLDTPSQDRHNNAMQHDALQALADLALRLQQAITETQDRVLDLRIIPVSTVFDRIPALVRKMAIAQQKDINLSITGKEVRIDKSMVDILMEPLIHLVRNCIDHGIEMPADRLNSGKPAQASLTLNAVQEGSMLVLNIADDGRGINVDLIRDSAIRKGFIQASDVLTDSQIYKLIFLPGFSTAAAITETSGRGVGMDVVINRVQHIGGDVDVQSQPGKGTRFLLKLPLAAAMQGVVLVQADQRLFAIPQDAVEEIIFASLAQFVPLQDHTTLTLREKLLPVCSLTALLQPDPTQGLIRPYRPQGTQTLLILRRHTQRLAIAIDDAVGREDIFIRGLHRDLRHLDILSGAAMLADGRLVFILNTAHLMQLAHHLPVFRLTQPALA